MILAFDTYYFEDKAKTVCIAFEHWTDAEPAYIFEEMQENISAYIPGEFYKRELPCIISLLEQISLPIRTIIVDGFVFLSDENKLGLGGYLYEALNKEIPIIGVAKTNFATIKKNKVAILRGKSIKPLFITSAGIEKNEAATYIKSMHGAYRFPTILKQVDALTRA